MRFKTVNEIDKFKFDDTHLSLVEYVNGSFNLVIDNVVICADNSCNRDIVDKRTNNLEFSIKNASVKSVVEEGYKIYNADGVLMEDNEDKPVNQEQYIDLFKSMEDSWLFSLKKKEDYELIIDANDHTYFIIVAGDSDVQEWDRFMNLEA